MPRKRRECGSRGAGKSIIKVFCEGESEQAYTEYLKRKFSDVAVIQYPKEPGLFDRAEERFKRIPNIGIIQKLSMRYGFSLMLKLRISINGMNGIG